jgi:hypothetical protein
LEILVGVGGDSRHSSSKETTEVYQRDQLNTKCFNPNPAYMDKIMDTQDICEYINDTACQFVLQIVFFC